MIEFCFYCHFSASRKLVTFSSKAEVFVVTGFSNWKKAVQKFNEHESCHAHKESCLKHQVLMKLHSVKQQLLTMAYRDQSVKREIFIIQLSVLRYLLQQGLAIRRHDDVMKKAILY